MTTAKNELFCVLQYKFLTGEWGTPAILASRENPANICEV